MKVMLLDGERAALEGLQGMLEEQEGLEVVGAFQHPAQAIEQAASLQPDAVFLEVQLPKVSGLLAAEMLQEICPEIEIVFVTSTDRYALQAFELNAVDYVLKPLRRDRLERTVNRLRKRRAVPAVQEKPAQEGTRILCLQSLRFQQPGRAPEVPRWRTAKAQELFAYLLHRRGELVHKETLLELLWPELDEQRAMTQLYTRVYQVRQCLSSMGLPVTIQNSRIQEGYVLDIGCVRIDLEEWECALEEAGSRLPGSAGELARLLELYEGNYFQEQGYWWAENERERLRRLWMQHARALARHYEESGSRQEEAAALYERMQEVDPYSERDGLALLKLYDEAGQHDRVKEKYRSMRHAFTDELGVEVPVPLVHWYEQWMRRTRKLAIVV